LFSPDASPLAWTAIEERQLCPTEIAGGVQMGSRDWFDGNRLENSRGNPPILAAFQDGTIGFV
jgi:hypothetical protein